MLYIVGTPIGNLDDLSLRQARTLSTSDIILAEDTRSALILIQGIKARFSLSFNPSQKIISYYKEKEFEKLPYIMELLHENRNVSLISESGLPLISDPGYLLIKTVIGSKLPLTVIPGPTAFSIAHVLSGFKNDQTLFIGFLPRKKSELQKIIKRLMDIKKIYPDLVISCYDSPNRVRDSLQVIIDSGWNPDIAVCREISKKFEEVVRGKAAEIINNKYRGEITMVLT